MFDIGAVELMVIAIVTIIVVGPKDLPGMLRNFGQFVAKMRGMAREFQNTFEEAARDTGIDEITKGVSDVKNFSVTKDVGKVFDPVTQEAATIKAGIEDAGKTGKTNGASAKEKPKAAKSSTKKKTTKVAAKKPPARKKPAPVKRTRPASRAKKSGKPAAAAKS